jgi:hypothetical protein
MSRKAGYLSLFKNANFHFHQTTVQNTIVENPVVLYFIVFLSFSYLYYLAFSEQIQTVAFFILIGVVISFFSKNLIVVLFLSLALTSLLQGSVTVGWVEGFETEEEPTPTAAAKKDDDADEEENKDEDEEETFDDNTTDPSLDSQAKDLLKINKQLLSKINDLTNTLEQSQSAWTKITGGVEPSKVTASA